MNVELARTASKLSDASNLLKEFGLNTWRRCDDWDGPYVTHNPKHYTATISDVEKYVKPSVEIMFLDRYEQLLLLNWVNASEFSVLVTSLYGERAPDNETLLVAQNNLLKGRRNQPKWLVSCVYSVLKHTAEYLTSQKVIHAHKIASKTGQQKLFEKHVRLMFDYATQLAAFVFDIQKNVYKKVSICEEAYCKDVVPQLRRGRCPACYAWVRRWQSANPEQLAPPVPKTVIDERFKIRANSPKKKMS